MICLLLVKEISLTFKIQEFIFRSPGTISSPGLQLEEKGIFDRYQPDRDHRVFLESFMGQGCELVKYIPLSDFPFTQRELKKV